jgi:uncharacterized membrane protein
MRDAMLIVHFIGLAMGLGTSFAMMFIGMASTKMEKAEALKFQLNAFALSRMGHIGLVLLIISGGYLMTPFWKSLSSTPLLIAKLVLVLVLAALIGIVSAKAKRAKRGEPEMHMKTIKLLGNLAMLTAVAIVVLAVMVFH